MMKKYVETLKEKQERKLIKMRKSQRKDETVKEFINRVFKKNQGGTNS